ncbi:hypothetical protein Hanom_Chr16g01517301 [Helianthus anomalus]
MQGSTCSLTSFLTLMSTLSCSYQWHHLHHGADQTSTTSVTNINTCNKEKSKLRF